jgi:hypothetical protein
MPRGEILGDGTEIRVQGRRHGPVEGNTGSKRDLGPGKGNLDPGKGILCPGKGIWALTCPREENLEPQTGRRGGGLGLRKRKQAQGRDARASGCVKWAGEGNLGSEAESWAQRKEVGSSG